MSEAHKIQCLYMFECENYCSVKCFAAAKKIYAFRLALQLNYKNMDIIAATLGAH